MSKKIDQIQTNFDHELLTTIDEHCGRERNLRIAALKDMKDREDLDLFNYRKRRSKSRLGCLSL